MPLFELAKAVSLVDARRKPPPEFQKMGNFDRRNSMKMKRLKAQVKKKTREAKRRTGKKAPVTTTAKRPAAKKKAPAAAPASQE